MTVVKFSRSWEQKQKNILRRGFLPFKKQENLLSFFFNHSTLWSMRIFFLLFDVSSLLCVLQSPLTSMELAFFIKPPTCVK